ncbi:MAG: AraC family transcriptional regulator [Tissierellia bacterium]|nr:AraC family transcriptional regulator [Tissierellia bacterium]
MKEIKKKHILQESTRSDIDPGRLADIDVDFVEKPTEPLFHQSARFLYVIKGHGTLELNKDPFEMKPGTLVSIVPWTLSEITEVKEPLTYIILKYSYHIFLKHTSDLFVHSREAHLLSLSLSQRAVSYDQKDLLDTFVKCRDISFETLNRMTHLSLSHANCLLFSYLLEIATYHSLRSSIDTTETPVPVKEKIFQYMYENSHKKITLKEISVLFFMSESSISRFIREKTGLSFFDLLNEMRVAKAMDLLVHTDLTHDEIADLLGYTDSSHFSKLFTTRLNMNPREYRSIYRSSHSGSTDTDIQILEEIVQNSHTDLSIKDISLKYHRSPMEINRRLKSIVGKNFADFLHYVRINKSIVRMLETNDPITDIAFEVGYNTMKTFQRNFLKLKHMTPSEFRKIATLQEVDKK